MSCIILAKMTVWVANREVHLWKMRNIFTQQHPTNSSITSRGRKQLSSEVGHIVSLPV